jgi:FtsH-binding integral membrane protein
MKVSGGLAIIIACIIICGLLSIINGILQKNADYIAIGSGAILGCIISVLLISTTEKKTKKKKNKSIKEGGFAI